MKIATIVTTSLLFVTPLFLAPALAADPVSLVGTWKGQDSGVGAQDGWTRHEVVLEIREQQGTAFKAVKSYGAPGAHEATDVYGSMTPDGRTVVVVDSDGVFTGSLAGPDRLDLCYAEAGDDATAACARLVRQK